MHHDAAIRRETAADLSSSAGQGFDAEGDAPFWSVTGDEVTAMELMDVDGDGKNELVVGGKVIGVLHPTCRRRAAPSTRAPAPCRSALRQDFAIRIFRNEDVVADITEADEITGLCSLGRSGLFGYTLANGTVGIYERGARKWRVKSKHQPTAVASYDLDGDGVPELITGWDNGKIEARQGSSRGDQSAKQLGRHCSAASALPALPPPPLPSYSLFSPPAGPQCRERRSLLPQQPGNPHRCPARLGPEEAGDGGAGRLQHRRRGPGVQQCNGALLESICPRVGRSGPSHTPPPGGPSFPLFKTHTPPIPQEKLPLASLL